MVDAAVAKAKEIGIGENVAILDDGGNLSRMGGAPILCIETAEDKAYTALFGVPAQGFFNSIQRRPVNVPTKSRTRYQMRIGDVRGGPRRA
jgi:uncharacterized protein GlcG (DUF336 family)